MIKVKISRELALNGRVHDLGYNVKPYNTHNKEIIKVKNRLVKDLQKRTGRKPLVRIRKRKVKGKVKRLYWLIKPVKSERIMSKSVLTKAGKRLKSKGKIISYGVRKVKARRLTTSRTVPYVLFVHTKR